MTCNRWSSWSSAWVIASLFLMYAKVRFFSLFPAPALYVSGVPLPEDYPITVPHTTRPPRSNPQKKGAVRQPLSRSKNQPVLVTHPTSTTSCGDQYCFLLVTSTGSIADQYWSQSPSSTSPPTSLYHKHLQILHFSPHDRPTVPLLHRESEEALTIGIVGKFG